jgi:hypothetical protein
MEVICSRIIELYGTLLFTIYLDAPSASNKPPPLPASPDDDDSMMAIMDETSSPVFMTSLQAATIKGESTVASRQDTGPDDEQFKNFLDAAIQDGQGEVAEGNDLLESLYAGEDTIMDDPMGRRKRTTERRSEDEKEAISAALQRNHVTWAVKPGTKKKGNDDEY